MLKIDNVVLPSPAQWEAIIRGTRNPMNSWDKSDSYITHIEDQETLETADYAFFVGDKDLDLMTRLSNGGPTHGKFKRMIPVYLDITAPLYWWKEFDTYKVGTVANSCSTMHKIHSKEFTLEDFSCEHLLSPLSPGDERMIPRVDASGIGDGSSTYSPKGLIECLLIPLLNDCRQRYLETNDKKFWWQMIQLLPSSYNQKRTVMLNYEVLTNVYQTRKGHRLDEWKVMLEWIQTLPYSELITGEKNNGDS